MTHQRPDCDVACGAEDRDDCAEMAYVDQHGEDPEYAECLDAIDIGGYAAYMQMTVERAGGPCPCTCHDAFDNV